MDFQLANIGLYASRDDDESLKRWKEQLLGCVESDLNGQMDSEVTFHSLGIISNDFGEINTPLPVDKLQNGKPLFLLKEGSEYWLKVSFTVLHNIVSGLTYTNAVWKGGMQGYILIFLDSDVIIDMLGLYTCTCSQFNRLPFFVYYQRVLGT